MSDEPNRDHRCRTCEHWGVKYRDFEERMCSCPVPEWCDNVAPDEARERKPTDGKYCESYAYSYRRARLVTT